MLKSLGDAPQQAQAFLISQLAHIEQGMWEVRYPDITYQRFVPVDTSANPWVKTVTYFSVDKTGRANWVNGKARDIPLVGMQREQFETSVHMAGIGYDYDIEELNQARLLGQNIPSDKAAIARRGYEELCEGVAYSGDAAKGFKGLINATTPTRVDVPNGASASPLWTSKTPDEILKDVNDALTGVWIGSNTVALADTVLLPLAQFSLISTKRIDAVNQTTLLEWIEKNNIYTKLTGQKLTIAPLRQLAGAGTGATNRMITYRRSPEVLKMHIPMPLQFLAPQQDLLRWVVPGIFRLGGVDIKLPYEVRYSDGI